MALGALIGAYQEDDGGGLRALYPLAGRTLLEYQARCAASVGASPVVVLAERSPSGLTDAVERLRAESIPVVLAVDAGDAASRFEAGSPVLLIADGLAPDVNLLRRLAEHAEPVIALVPDDESHRAFERIDAEHRWAGCAIVDAAALGSTVAILGDWDLQSTLLRRTVQDGALRIEASVDGQRDASLLAEHAEDLAGFERHLLVASRGIRRDFTSRYLLPPIEEFITERLMESRVRPTWPVFLAVALTTLAAFGFTRGWLWQSYGLMLVSLPLDLVGARLATLRLRPLTAGAGGRRLLWPLAGVAVMALAWWVARHGGDWGAILAALTGAAFAQADRLERSGVDMPGALWSFSRRNAIVLALPFVIAGWWTALLLSLLLYAAGSFFAAQHLRHRILRD